MMSKHHLARYWQRTEAGVACTLCPHQCLLTDGQRGRCGVRQADHGKLFTMNYARLAAASIDPIEKKPLYHFHPGSATFSVAAVGCNLTCDHCQNYSLSDTPRVTGRMDGQTVPPDEIVRNAQTEQCRIIAYTYSEPTVYYEYMIATARWAREQELLNIAVTNGYINEAPLRELAPYLDAVNIDLKSFSDDFYRQTCGGMLAPVLHTIETAVALGIWVEVTTLVIPGLNDSEEELGKLAGFIKSISPDIPWHVSAFHPTHRLTDRARTPAATLLRTREIGRDEGLHYVYTGNICDVEGGATYCPGCRLKVVARQGFVVENQKIIEGKCADCGARIAGRW